MATAHSVICLVLKPPEKSDISPLDFFANRGNAVYLVNRFLCIHKSYLQYLKASIIVIFLLFQQYLSDTCRRKMPERRKKIQI